MPWVFLAIAVGCLAVAMKTQSIGLALVALLLALGFMVLGALGFVSSRIQGRSQSAASMMSGDALAAVRKAREQKAGGSGAAADGGAGGSRSGRDRHADDDGDGDGPDGGDGGGD